MANKAGKLIGVEVIPAAVENAKKNGVSVRRIGDSSFLWLGDAEIRIYQCTEYADTNARSLMLKVTYGQCNLLLCADITGKTQLYFAENLPEGLLDVEYRKVLDAVCNTI